MENQENQNKKQQLEQLQQFIEDYKYLSINHDGNYVMYTSLRKMANVLLIDYSTISKKLKENGTFIFTSKQNQNPIYIRKL